MGRLTRLMSAVNELILYFSSVAIIARREHNPAKRAGGVKGRERLVWRPLILTSICLNSLAGSESSAIKCQTVTAAIDTTIMRRRIADAFS